MKLKIKCDWCGKTMVRCPSQIKNHNFCSRSCLADFSNKSKNPEGYKLLKDYTNMGKHMSEMNRRLNPTRMTEETRSKLRACHLSEGNGRTYAKIYGEKVHRLVAEKMIGRPLLPNEVVHHIDQNKRNNDPNNLMVMTPSEHSRLHARQRKLWSDDRFREESI